MQCPNGRFPLPITSTRSSPIKRLGTGQAGSAGMVGVVCLAWHRSGFLPENKILDISQNSSRDREAKRSRSHREVIEYWLNRGRVDQEMFFYDRVEI